MKTQHEPAIWPMYTDKGVITTSHERNFQKEFEERAQLRRLIALEHLRMMAEINTPRTLRVWDGVLVLTTLFAIVWVLS
jgi:hypothetical protein